MSPRTMRVLFVNVSVLLVVFSVIQAVQRGGSISPALRAAPVSSKYGQFLDHAESGKDSNSAILLQLMQEHFDLSMEYLLTSKQYGSQYVQRPGMAKFLNEASDRQWEEGMDILKKFFQRGGSITDDAFKPAFNIAGKPQLTFASNENMNIEYVNTLKKILEDSKGLTRTMNHLHRLAGKPYDHGGDAEIAHYFDAKLEKEAEIAREMAGHVNTLQKMNKLGVALNMFDSNL